MDVVRITADPISMDALLAELSPGDEVGAVVTFAGLVRATEGDRRIPALEYEQYRGMAEQEMVRLVRLARERWPLHRVGLVHRVGSVAVGEASVHVAVLAGHRAEAFEAARFLIDELKKSVPIWKKAPAGERP